MKVYVVIKSALSWDGDAVDIVGSYIDPGMAEGQREKLETEELDINTEYRVEEHEVN